MRNIRSRAMGIAAGIGLTVGAFAGVLATAQAMASPDAYTLPVVSQPVTAPEAPQFTGAGVFNERATLDTNQIEEGDRAWCNDGALDADIADVHNCTFEDLDEMH